MRISFDSLEETCKFVDEYRRSSYTAGEVRPGNIDPNAFARELWKLANGDRFKKITAIKVFRAVTGWGLKESKLAIDRNWI